MATKVYKSVLTKKDFVYRYAQGEFGNHAPTWLTVEQYCESDYCGLVHLRNRVPNGPTYYNLEPMQVWHTLNRLYKHQEDINNWYISAMAPTEQTLFQGEVMRGLWGLELTYTTVTKPMRDALAEYTKISRGILASLLLQHYLCPNSWEWLNVLLDRYPNHVVEFSTYAKNWGTLSNFNTVFWEVRNY